METDISWDLDTSLADLSLLRKAVEEQKSNFNDLIEDLGCCENEEIIAILSEREMALPED